MPITFTEIPFTEITGLPGNGAWHTMDLTSFGVADNSVVLIGVKNTRGSDSIGGVRAVGSAINRYIDFFTDTVITLFVTQTNSAAAIQLYSESFITFYVLGYWEGITYTEAFETIDVTGDASQTWTEKTLSDSDGARVHTFIFGSIDISQFNVGGVRTNGSILNRAVTLDSPIAGVGIAPGTTTAKTDVDGKIEAYSGIDQTEMLYWNMGYFSELMDYNESHQRNITASVEDTWTDKDLTAFLGEDGQVADLYCTNNDENNNWDAGARINGSSDNRIFGVRAPNDSGATHGFQIPTSTDGDGVLEYWNMETDHVNIYQYGYFFEAESIFPHKVDGVEGSTIATIIGVGVENIGKVMGVG